jgi:hypothetical protein
MSGRKTRKSDLKNLRAVRGPVHKCSIRAQLVITPVKNKDGWVQQLNELRQLMHGSVQQSAGSAGYAFCDESGLTGGSWKRGWREEAGGLFSRPTEKAEVIINKWLSDRAAVIAFLKLFSDGAVPIADLRLRKGSA